jgi:pyridinium-3,5-bisthiocarboxylic acid mononucleotide nickel chelatase
VGSGRVRTAHGELPVPVPAVLRLAAGWEVQAGGDGELATPTGMALLRTLCSACEDLPSMLVETTGAGAGTRDVEGRANVVRVVIGSRTPSPDSESAVLLEANVDDLDPRLWPGILTGLLAAGAADAWLVPIVMKKGRPAHTLTVLCSPAVAGDLREQVFRETSTLGVRESPRRKVALERMFVDVAVAGEKVPVKVAHRGGRILQVMPEFEDVAALARRQGRPERVVLQEAIAAATAAGLTVGAPVPSP